MGQKKFYNLILLFCMAYFCGVGAASAKDISVIIKLDRIEVRKLSEKMGDELYIGVTQYSSLGHSKTDRIPAKPAYWLSRQLSLVNNVVLWEGDIEEDEETKVILSLVEKDLSPWDVDDLIGSAEIVLTNQKGQLKKQWGIPVFEERVEVDMEKPGNPQRFLMKGDKSEYSLQFRVDEK